MYIFYVYFLNKNTENKIEITDKKHNFMFRNNDHAYG